MKKKNKLPSILLMIVIMIALITMPLLCACGDKNGKDDSSDPTTGDEVNRETDLSSDENSGNSNTEDDLSDDQNGFTPELDTINPVVYSAEELQQVADFQTAVKDLPMDDIPSALELLRAFKSVASEIYTNDALFLEYEETMQSVAEGLNGSIEEEMPDDTTIMNAVENGFLLVEEDDFPHFILRPDFFCDTFSPYVSGPVQAMLELRKKHYYFAGEHDFIENSTLMVTLDQLAEMIIDWENYLNRYREFIDIAPIAYNLDYYLTIYVGSNQIENSGFYLDMGTDQNGDVLLKLADEPLESYQKFIENFPNSLYTPIISGLYTVYEKHNFLYTVDIEIFFIENGLDVPY